MRPESLYILFSPVTRIKGVGPRIGSALARLLPVATQISGASVPIIRDLLFHLPVGLLDRRYTCGLGEIPNEGVVATFVVQVDEHEEPKKHSKKPYKVYCSNDTGSITLVFFNVHGDYLTRALPVGQKRVISGRVEKRDGLAQMAHPDIIAPVSQLAEVQKPEPVYPLTADISNKRVASLVAEALAQLPDLPEWITPERLAEQHWPSWKEALLKAHHPEENADLEPSATVRLRLAYDEMLSNQLHLALLRRTMQAQAGERISGTGVLTTPLLAALPFALTAGQQRVLAEIAADMTSGQRMTRLLQGDVGSGKTIVALIAMLRAVEQGMQAALMVPTEIIASQHFEVISKLLSALPNVKTVLLTGSVKGKAREQVLANIGSGEAHVVIGTHALFQEHVHFHNLALVVIDEQHRFGVNQRMALTAKGDSPHLLHMTATPIPRSLTMTLYGDMDCSLLTEKPAERQPITTRVIPLSRYEEVMERMKSALARGEKAYWICPLIDEKYGEGELALTPELDLAAAQTRFTEFKARFGDQVGLVHGRMKAAERDVAMHDFASGKTRLLVATTVVEVGVDVRDATIIVIEKAERFGLSQLHQLRGRVGRGDKASACVLLYTDYIGEVARERLSILRDTEDGFKIAEADLNIRGGGDLLGVRQSGLPRFIFMNIFLHQELLTKARSDVELLLSHDPQLASEQGKAMTILRELFGNEAD
ncbi:MAG: ATP-dependent DNA helicase RecG [Rickettsiales bacterium]|nr:ATP-dependent DNA helicase RecG [Rickettsiales bacterium]